MRNAINETDWLYCDGKMVTLKTDYGVRVATSKSLEKLQAMNLDKVYEVRNKPYFGEWFDFGFFKVKGFKKGTGHFKFKDRDVWALFNQRICKIKGFPLPEAVKSKS